MIKNTKNSFKLLLLITSLFLASFGYSQVGIVKGTVVDEKGVPMILKCELWVSMLPLLRHRAFFLDDIELMFLNQVSNT